MARRPLDWITIKYRDIYTIIVTVIVLILLVGGYFFYKNLTKTPKMKAYRVMQKAEKLLNTIDALQGKEAFTKEIDSERAVLNQAQGYYRLKKYDESLSTATAMLDPLKSIADRINQAQKFAVVIALEGLVEIKQTTQFVFSRGRDGQVLEKGDMIKTGSDSSCKIRFQNGEIKTITPDTMILIQDLAKTENGTKVVTEIKHGMVESITPDTMRDTDTSKTITPTAEIDVHKASRTVVGVNPTSGQTDLSVPTGSATIKSGGITKQLESNTTVATTDNGIGQVRQLLSPPEIETPKDQQIIISEHPESQVVTLGWKPSNASDYNVEISTRQLFSSKILSQSTKNLHLEVEGLATGVYYWRIKSSEKDNTDAGYWSQPYRFRLQQLIPRPKIVRTLTLDVELTQVSDAVIIQGKTNPGVMISINDLEAPVEADGSFLKTILISETGKQAITVRAFDREGNETIKKEYLHYDE